MSPHRCDILRIIYIHEFRRHGMRGWLAVLGAVVFVSLSSLKNRGYDGDIGNELMKDLE